MRMDVWYCRIQGSESLVLLKRMVAELVHRGPDDDGVFLDGSTGLDRKRCPAVAFLKMS